MAEARTETARRELRGVEFSNSSILEDYRIAYRSRQASLLGRREVLTGKAKFGIFGDGKEVAQVALARAARAGDVRSGYYRDQTLMMALGELTVPQFFAQLFADPSTERDPSTAGRQMNAHFSSRLLDERGEWLRHLDAPRTSADMSPTAGQMPRLVGLGFASRLYRELPELADLLPGFSENGNEIAIGTIGNASCAEGLFWEAVNAIGVLRAPVLLSIWDDEYGISVPNEYQLARDLSSLLSGFRRAEGDGGGIDLYTVRGWDYPGLCETYLQAAEIVRREHVPAVVHVIEMTQPQGHSTSGSQERYKSEERLRWEEEHDCLPRMRRWMEESEIAAASELDELEEEERRRVSEWKQEAWDAFREPIEADRKAFLDLARAVAEESGRSDELQPVVERIERQAAPLRRDLHAAALEVLAATRDDAGDARARLVAWRREQDAESAKRYDSDQLSESERSPLRTEAVPPRYADDTPTVNGFEVINACFDAALERLPQLFIFGEDVGKLGDVNQGCLGLQEKYGELRVFDTGIRETTILGQAIGMAMRGLRPIAEIQYLDYVLYCLQTMSDDLATVRYRSAGGQMAPVIVRTRGHRLEGIWHAGSPMGGILNLVRGIHVCVPRDMTRAAGMYNTLLAGDDPAFVVEVLNGYRIKERLPENVGEFKVPLGVPEVLREGSDVTVVTYGACCRIALDAATVLSGLGIEAEVIDVQTLLPFDREGRIVESLERTARVLFLDEDMPGGASAFMMQRVLDRDGGWVWLDAAPRALAAKPHRPAYGSDGDYFSKPNREQVVEAAYELVREADPKRFPPLV